MRCRSRITLCRKQIRSIQAIYSITGLPPVLATQRHVASEKGEDHIHLTTMEGPHVHCFAPHYASATTRQ